MTNQSKLVESFKDVIEKQIYDLPTGKLIVDEYDKGRLETLSIGDYGKERNIKANFLGHTRHIEGVENGDMKPLQEKWVMTLSTQYGCPMKCKFCSVPNVGYNGNASCEDLYNQFSYGIQKHPYSIIAFLEYAKKTWAIEPKQVFLIGQGYHMPNYRNNETLYAKTLIPTMGNPATDLLYTVSPQGKSIKTTIGIGRLSAQTLTDVENYRNKVRDFEAQEPNPWMKTVLHFGGGSTAYEQSLFRYYLSQYERTLEGEYFGANVHSFYKESSDVYETTEPEAIRGYMNAGTSMLTFFGHAS